jgi:hypothetical protein
MLVSALDTFSERFYILAIVSCQSIKSSYFSSVDTVFHHEDTVLYSFTDNFVCSFETGSYPTAQASLKLTIFPPQPPSTGIYGCASPLKPAIDNF